jgi:pilus assembly protein CpaF
LVQEALDAYGERTSAGLLPTVADPERAAAALYHRVAGAGPLQRYLDDDEVEEIWLK